MISKDKKPAHRKHAALARPFAGQFGRHEFAFVGTDCAAIKLVCGRVISALAPRWQIGYVDAAHPKGDCPEILPEKLAQGASIEFSDNISHRQFLLKNASSAFQNRPFFNETNLIFINGNHFAGQKQVVFIDPKKEESLKKRLAQLTDVVAFVLAEGQNAPFDWLKIALPNWAEIPVFHQKGLAELIAFFEKKAAETVAPLHGLVLAGGKSERMGRDKGAIEWHDGQPQREFLANLLAEAVPAASAAENKTVTPENKAAPTASIADDLPATAEFLEKNGPRSAAEPAGTGQRVFISARPGQLPGAAQFPNSPIPQFPILEDSFLGLGPFGAILSAFREKPGAAWLVVACDLPLLDRATIDFLIENRRPDCVATAFRNPENGMPEPLITIWEPMAYAVLLSFLAQGYACPRKVLMNSNCHLLDAPDPAALTNVNTPEDAAAVKLGGLNF